jgi:uncharacterized membrane protein (DUF2068 family)
MTEQNAVPMIVDLAPVKGGEEAKSATIWGQRLLIFLRIMSGISMLNGLRYWAAVCGIAFVAAGGFEAQPVAWQTATVFYAVIDLVAAVGLWLAAPWGAVVWLTSAVSMVVIQVLFPQIYDDSFLIVLFQPVVIAIYLALAVLAAREQMQQPS